ncbi:sodium:calcium antiporter [Alicyclobacillus mali (ex Roth et al. 2021)]|uniref:sodium:calcium antiporter n=1 Tax=Alicyclobacillus mali (ex Roth et al. 2021) TaxID=1123961 RepID=UPI0023F1D621|nr:sodium:calcium antiporter [Alicyclobacillus mali (ex Roth et al. 2021)]
MRAEVDEVIAVQMLFGLCMVLFGAELLTNAVEWLGMKLGLGESAVGSVLAALGTALPETAVPMTAIVLGGGHEAEQVGIGGILGAPFLLVTLGGLVLAIAAMVFRRGCSPRDIAVSSGAFRRDLAFFFVGFSLSLVPAAWPAPALKVMVACLLVGLYAAFIRAHVREGVKAGSAGDLRPLYLNLRQGDPAGAVVLLQLAFALALVLGGAHLLTDGVASIAARTQMPTFLLSALVIPVATELPETLNSVVWMRDRKDGLAVGNVTGAMVFQGTLVPAIGMLFTDWTFTRAAWWTAGLTLAATAFLLLSGLRTPRIEAWTLVFASVAYFALPLAASHPGALPPSARLALWAAMSAAAALGASLLVWRRTPSLRR